jgi:NAD(P)-dependent dehydrogenase (short-subunit alcohol dehydrogenase family)
MATWSTACWLGPEDVAVQMRELLPDLAATWHVAKHPKALPRAAGRGEVELLVNAAVLDAGTPLEAGIAAVDRVVGARGALRRVVSIVTTAWLGVDGDEREAMRCAAVVAHSRAQALRRAADGITVNTIALATAYRTGDVPAGAPLTRAVGMHDLANALQFFADPESHYITGQTLNICAGTTVLSSMSV